MAWSRRIPAGRAVGRRSRMRAAGFERLEDRWLLATLTVGMGGTFSTIQQAVNQARSGDTVEIADGEFAESVNLSLMGSAIGRQPGDLRIRGTGPSVVITSPGGPAIFNSAAFSGDLTLERLTLQSPTSTAAQDSGLHLDGYAGQLSVSNILVRETRDTGLRIANASGTLTIRDNELSDAGDGAGDHGIHLSQVTGVALITDNSLRELSDEGVVITLSGGGQLVASVSDNTISGDPINFTTTQRGIRIEASGTSRVDATVEGNSLDDLNSTALSVLASESAQVQAQLDGNIIFNGNQGTMIVLRAQDTSRLAFSFDDNTLSDSRAEAMQLSLGGSAQVNAHIRNNLFFNIGDGSGDDGLIITADTNSSATLNALLNFNDFVTIAGTGTLVEGLGSTTYNLTISENSYSDVNTASGVSAVLLTKVNTSVTAQFNVDFVDNTVNQSTQGGFRFEQRGSGPFRLEGDAATVLEQVESTNTGLLTTSGTIALVAPGIFDETVPLLLGDLVWSDDDGDGIQDSTEPGLSKVQISLTGTESSSGSAVQRRTISDRNGKYQFSGLLPGNYVLQIEPFAGFSLAAVGQGADPTLDNDFPRPSRSVNVSLSAATNRFDIDVGMIRNWQNPVLPVDVNNDGIVAPNDALVVINDLNANGPRPLSLPPVPPNEPPPFLDVNGDTLVAPVDVLQVINALNSGGSGEGEAWGQDVAGEVTKAPAATKVPAAVSAARPTSQPLVILTSLREPDELDRPAVDATRSDGSRATRPIPPAVSMAGGRMAAATRPTAVPPSLPACELGHEWSQLLELLADDIWHAQSPGGSVTRGQGPGVNDTVQTWNRCS